MIIKVSFENFKGQTEERELTGRDIFTGANGVGKSTVAQAVALAVQGYMPGGQKRAEDVFQYATGQHMSVGIKTDSGFEIKRIFTKTATVDRNTGLESAKINQTLLVIPSNGESTIAAKEQRIAAEIGNIPLMFDFNELNAMSDSKRRDFIYQIAEYDREKYGLGMIKKYIETKTDMIPDEEMHEEAVNAMEDVLSRYPENAGFEEGLKALQKYTYTRVIKYKETRLEATAAGKKLMDYKNELAATAKGIESEKATIQDLNKKIEDISGEIGKIEQQEKEREAIETLLKRERQYKRINEEEVTAFQAKLEEIDKLIDVLPPSPMFDEETGSAEVEEQKKNDIAPYEKNIDAATEMMRELDHLKALAGSEGRGLMHSVKKLEDMKCPVMEGWDCPQDWAGTAQNLKGKADVLFSEAAKYEKRKESLLMQIQRDKDKLREINYNYQLKATERADSYKAYDQEAEKWEKRYSHLEVERRRTQKLIEKTATSLLRNIEKIEEYEGIIATTAKADTAPIESLKLMLEGYRDNRQKLTASVGEKHKAMATLETMLQATEEARRAELLFVAYNDLYRHLGPKGVQGEIVKEIVSPLENQMTKKIRTMPGFGNFNFKFVTKSSTGQEIFKYGWENDKGNLILYPALSTSEKAILTTVMLSVLIENLSIPTKIFILDNIENLDSCKIDPFIDTLMAIGGTFDNIIIAGVTAGDEKRKKGFKTWHLG